MIIYFNDVVGMKMSNGFIDIYRKYSDEEQVLIYQMGKVGSVALEDSINNAIHVHSLRGLKYEPTPSYLGFVKSRNNFQQLFLRFNDLKYFVKRYSLSRRKKIKIIVGVREPISRNVSMFFQELYSWIFRYMTGFPGKKTWLSSNRDEGMGFLYDAFRCAYDHNYGVEWFDNEFRKVTGIDVYEHDFDKELGYTVINKGKYEVFIYKIENLKYLTEELSGFLAKKIVIGNGNTGSKKWYSDVYREFINTFRFEDEYVDSLCNSKFTKHFYTKSEIINIKDKFNK